MDILAGIFLTLAYFLTAKGKAFYSLFFFFLANVCFLVESIQHHSIFGSIPISIGILTEIYVAFLMHKGKFHKDLNKE